MVEKIDEQGGEFSHGVQKAKKNMLRMKNKTIANMEELVNEKLKKPS